MNLLSLIFVVILTLSSVYSIEIDWENVRRDIMVVDSKISAPKRPRNKIRGRIVGGITTRFIEQLPYQVGILSIADDGAANLCGGSLISDKWVLTAAHCLEGKSESNIYLGEKWHGLQYDNFKGVEVKVLKDNYIIHENYTRRVFANDIALIKFKEPVTLTEKIRTIDLPSNEDLDKTKFDNEVAIASGWGAISNTESGTNIPLQYAYTKIIDEETCKKSFGSIILPQHICTSGEEAMGVCAGDSGGPLTVNVRQQRIIVGIASFISGQGCEAAHPRAFARVTEFLDWIREKTNNEV